MDGCRKKYKIRSEAEYKNLINRLNRIEGQVRGIRGMLEENAYCVDILTQVSAVQAALNAFDKELLNDHIRTCVTDGIRNGDNAVVDEFVTVIGRMIK